MNLSSSAFPTIYAHLFEGRHYIRHDVSVEPEISLVAQQLATMLLVQASRVHLAEGTNRSVGRLFALADKQMHMEIAAMHQNPAHR